jgi:hypothetical protein
MILGIKKAALAAALISTLYIYFNNFGGITRPSFGKYFCLFLNELGRIGVIWGVDEKFPILGTGVI